MKYILFHDIAGPAGEFIATTRNAIAKRFGANEGAKRNPPPHFTLKYSVPDLEPLERIVQEFARTHRAAPYTLDGYDFFPDQNTIYVNVRPSEALRVLQQELHSALRADPRITWNSYETRPQLHASLSHGDITTRFDGIWDYVQNLPRPRYDLLLDSISIYALDDRKDATWQLVKRFPLLPTERR
jgi:hypothetical protein